jgi:DNA polymerase alpha-associated DNA helicase A
MAPNPTDIPSFATTQLSLLSAELDAEAAETALLLSSQPPQILARAGLAILNLTVSSLRTGLGGKTVVELALDSAVTGGKDRDGRLPEHDIRTGDIVRVGDLPTGGAKKKDREELKAKGFEGVVTRVGERAVWVALGKDGRDDEDLSSGRLWL